MAKNKVFIALDSDILRTLADFDNLLQTYPDFDTKFAHDFFIRENGNYLKKMLSLIKSGKLSIFVGSAVFREVKHRVDCIEFIKKYCYMPKMNASNFAEMVTQSDNLAFKYCTQKYVYKDKEYYPPMELHYSAYLKRDVPSNDAYAMAEATIAGCIFITNNGQDFIFRKYLKDDKNSRLVGITILNTQEGYYSASEDGSQIVPRPMEFYRFVPLLRKGLDNLMLPNVDENDFEKANNIL